MSNQLKEQPTIPAILKRLDNIERRVGLGKYAPWSHLTDIQRAERNAEQDKHGERVEARQKQNG